VTIFITFTLIVAKGHYFVRSELIQAPLFLLVFILLYQLLLRVFQHGRAAAAILKRAITRATLLSGPLALISPCKISRPRTMLREKWDVAGRMVARVQGLYFWEDGRKDRLASLALLLATLLRLKASKARGRILTGPWGYNRALPFTREGDLTNLPGLLLQTIYFISMQVAVLENRLAKSYFAGDNIK